MGPNRISAELDDQAIHQIEDFLKAIHQQLPFLVTLPAEDRPYLLSIGEKLLPYVSKALEDARQHPELVPPFLDLDELERDILLFAKLHRVLQPLRELIELVNDTTTAAGSDAFETAVSFYKNVRMNARLGDSTAEKILEELRLALPQNQKGSLNV